MSWQKTLRGPRFNEVAGILVLLTATIVGAALISYRADDPSWWFETSREPRNWIGPFGANLSRAVYELFGLGAAILPIALVILGFSAISRHTRTPSWSRAIGLLTVVVSFSALLATFFPRDLEFRGDLIPPGGILGSGIAGLATSQVGRIGAFFLALAALCLGLIFSTHFSFVSAGSIASRPMRRWSQALRVGWARLKESRRKERMRRAVVRKHTREQRRRDREMKRRQRETIRHAAGASDKPARPAKRARRTVVMPGADEEESGPVPRTGDRPDGPVVARAMTVEAEQEQPPLPLRAPPKPAIKLPPIDLLEPPPEESPVDERELIERARLITEKLREFSVEGQVVQIHPGPVVTTFEFKPEAGVKYSRILTLVDDLCLAVRAESIRVDRIPGKSTVGMEIPNHIKETIHLRDVIGSTAFTASRGRLTLALGKKIDGDAYITNLERMPHLLIAGSTGSGKSVGLNCMINSILYKATPEEVRFILIDPKMLELGVYADVPHLLIPVVTDMKKAAVALRWAVREMENRYKILASTGVRNVEQFNHLLRKEPDRTRKNEKTGEEEPLRPLPYIVIVIDELADLMMVASVDVEESITRLAQMARAVGIHLVLATQRPSVDVITGIIKANFPSRLAFRVSQKVDSRTILDTIGAEALLGNGDMLFLPPGSSRLIRVHGALITEAEIFRVVEFLKTQADPSYDDSVLTEPEEEGREGIDAERDEMYDEAVRLVVRTGQASISHLQRRLRLGYARAARIVDMMEDEGIVSPGEGAKPREILVGPEFLERLDQIAEER